MQNTAPTTKQPTPVLLYVPNIIGYVRIVFLAVFILCAFRMPVLAFWAYAFSSLLDAADGYTARKFNQISKLGTTLDFAIDRATIVALELVLAMVYRDLWMLFATLMMLDIFSHLCQLYFTVFSKTDSHKSQSIKQGRWLQLYYGSRAVLFISCFSHDGFLLLWYIYHFTGHTGFLYASILFLPGFVFKIAIHCLQISNTFQRIIKIDEASQSV